jgi:hypothetical protein
MAKICWTTLVLTDSDGARLGSGLGDFDEWIGALKRWRKRGYIAGLFFERTGGKHETSSPDTWGPKYPVHVDWRHFPTYTISFDDEEGTRVEVWGDNLIELRERLRDVDYKGSSIVVRNDAGEFVGTVTATSYRYT